MASRSNTFVCLPAPHPQFQNVPWSTDIQAPSFYPACLSPRTSGACPLLPSVFPQPGPFPPPSHPLTDWPWLFSPACHCHCGTTDPSVRLGASLSPQAGALAVHCCAPSPWRPSPPPAPRPPAGAPQCLLMRLCVAGLGKSELGTSWPPQPRTILELPHQWPNLEGGPDRQLAGVAGCGRGFQ